MPRLGRGARRQQVARTRRGLTLIELLVSISIVSILAALLLGVAAAATGTAREAKTKSMITRLHSLLMPRYDIYRTRRVETSDLAVAALLADTNPNDQFSDYAGVRLPLRTQQQEAAARTAAVREMMLVEMPDRWSDIVGHQLPTSLVAITSRHITPSVSSPPYYFLEDDPQVWSAYARAYNRILPPNVNTLTGAVNTRADILANQGAECLYLVIMNATGDGEAPGLFSENDVGDTDGDGALEFLDGWGNPISYIRWAPGFESDAQLSVSGLQRIFRKPPRGENGVRPPGNQAVLEAIDQDHDPYDLFRLDNPTTVRFNATTDDPEMRGWRLVPLIVSAGSDEELGLRDGVEIVGTNTEETFLAAADPYADADTSTTGIQRLGQPTNAEATADNIHNHQLGTLIRTK